jgi:hypothetical protein
MVIYVELCNRPQRSMACPANGETPRQPNIELQNSTHLIDSFCRCFRLWPFFSYSLVCWHGETPTGRKTRKLWNLFLESKCPGFAVRWLVERRWSLSITIMLTWLPFRDWWCRWLRRGMECAADLKQDYLLLVRIYLVLGDFEILQLTTILVHICRRPPIVSFKFKIGTLPILKLRHLIIIDINEIGFIRYQMRKT